MPPNRVAGDVAVLGVERRQARDIGPRLEHAGHAETLIFLVGAARLGGDHDRGVGSVRELRLVAAAVVLVVVGRQRVQEQGHPDYQGNLQPYAVYIPAGSAPNRGYAGCQDAVRRPGDRDLRVAVVPAASLAKFTSAKRGEMLPAASAAPCC
jgi:hypothetical protein